MAGTDPSEGLSIVIPTYNERDNIGQLMRDLRAVQPRLHRPLEVVLVDDNSPDGTAGMAERLGRDLPMNLRILARNGPRGLGGAIATGLQMCQWNLVCVMDADLSHPATLVPSLVDSIDGIDGVVASRYVSGGRIESWPLVRRLTSAVATVMARIFLRIEQKDPLSGFFLLRRSAFQDANITGDGNKPLLEILVSARPRVKEIPYRFHNRKNGESKLDGDGILDFVRLLSRLRSAAAAGIQARRRVTERGTLDRELTG